MEIERLANSVPTSAGSGVVRKMTREKWLDEVFPEWHWMLNLEIENTQLKKGQFGLWFLGGPSWAYKSSGGATFLIDNFSGSSLTSEYHYCGVCRTSGAPNLTWLRTNPHVIDPWKFNKLDAVFATHHHQDHADFYTVKATLNTTDCKYIGPKNTCVLFRRWGVPEDRIIEVAPGETFNIKDVEVVIEENFDPMAAMTGDYKPGDKIDYGINSVSFLLRNEGNSVIFLGDTLYHNGYKAVGARNEIDVAIMDMGHNAPGITDKMTPFDAFRVGQALGAKLIIPDHYENWASSEIDPKQLVDIVKQNDPTIKTVLMKHGGLFIYPDHQDIGEYRYDDYRSRFDWEKSYVYGKVED